MKCPVCSREMVEQDFGIKVDVCKNGCKEIWFDQGELVNLDEKNEGLGEALKEALNYPRANEGGRGSFCAPNAVFQCRHISIRGPRKLMLMNVTTAAVSSWMPEKLLRYAIHI